MQMNLNYREYGAGAPIVILHGLLGSSRNWHSAARHLAARNKIVVVDLRNHGDSPHAEQMDYPAMAADVRALLDKLDCAPVTMLGHSMGGKAAMLLALTAPAQIERLIVVDIAPVRYTDRFAELLDAMQAMPLHQLSGRAAADAELAHSIADAQLRQFLLQNRTQGKDGFKWRANLVAIRAHLDGILGFPDVAADVQFRGDALFISGGQSVSVDAVHHDAIFARFPNARIDTIAAAGHWPHAERREEFLSTLDRFLIQP